MKQIAVYLDEGVSTSSFQKTFEMLIAHTSSYDIRAVNHHFFAENNWEKATTLVVFPGGRDLFYHASLRGELNARIKAYVEQGGRFLGICAGGYYGASYIEFEKGETLEVCGARELGFFPGKAIGPVYEKGIFRYEDARGTRPALISWEQGPSYVFYKGGCLFEGAEAFSSVEVIGRYLDLFGAPAAIIKCDVGLGKALLSGIHPEYSTETLFKYIINKILT